jgi:hypothetical protein
VNTSFEACAEAEWIARRATRKGYVHIRDFAVLNHDVDALC